jgi:acetyl esterase/lipase
MPKIRIVVGTEDVIYDDSIRLADRFIELGVDVKLTEFEGFIHGA